MTVVGKAVRCHSGRQRRICYANEGKKRYCLAYTAYYMYYKYILRYFLDIFMETVDFKFDEIKKEKVKIVKI